MEATNEPISTGSGRNKKKRRRILILAVVLATIAVVLPFMLLLRHEDAPSGDDERNMPHDYVYAESVASNLVELHVLRTRPSNVTLAAIHNNVAVSPYYGVNGGFFYGDELLSIAVVNGEPVNAGWGTYGTGGQNVKYARGTLVWDGAADKMSVQVASGSSELAVSDRSDYWAQGGISMGLGAGEDWLAEAFAENAPFPDEDRLRSAAVYDADGYLYLVVSATKGTLAEFRAAILQRVGDGRLVDGIFLDGDGSSQLRSRERRLSGDGRPVVQMLALLR